MAEKDPKNKNPESMKPTPASKVIVVRAANEVVYQAARKIANADPSLDNRVPLIRAAKKFIGEK